MYYYPLQLAALIRGEFIKKMENIDKNAGKPVLKLTVNKKSYDWFDQYITTEQIRELGEIKEGDRLYLSVKEPWLDELILPGN